jgi:hypothetical protein
MKLIMGAITTVVGKYKSTKFNCSWIVLHQTISMGMSKLEPVFFLPAIFLPLDTKYPIIILNNFEATPTNIVYRMTMEISS